MAVNSSVEWCDNTFNPWWGCTKISPACKHCYAERLARRFGTKWGDDNARTPASDKQWAQPLVWQRGAQRKHRRKRVFCASMADVFEDRPELPPLRERLWMLIDETPMLDWMLLTKRPENIARMLPPGWRAKLRRNVWLGTTAETQAYANERIPQLLEVPAAVHFVSAEPLLEPVSLRQFDLDWVIVGGESGPGSRDMSSDWVRAIRDGCQEDRIPFFFKQWGGLRKKDTGRKLDRRQWSELPKQSRLFAPPNMASLPT